MTRVWTWVEEVMGLPVSVHVRPGEERAEAETAVRALYAELRTVDRVLSMWKPGSDISRLARGEVSVDGCDPMVAEVLGLCEQAREATAGAFDHERVGADGVRRLDPTGLVKGWAVERAARHLDGVVGDYYVNGGGDLVIRSASGAPWRIGIEEPSVLSPVMSRRGVLSVVEVVDGAVATSGTSARGDHVDDPRTGRPAYGLVQASLVGPSLTWADVHATAAVALGRDAVRWLRGLDGYAWLVVDVDGVVSRADDWPGT